MSSKVEVTLGVAPTLNFALEQAGVPLLTGFRLRNLGTEALAGATLEAALEPDLGDPVVIPLDTVPPGEDIELASLELRLPPGKLRAVSEAEHAELCWAVKQGAEVVAQGESPVEVLAFNEWPGLRAPPALLASFVLPNHPVVSQLLRAARDELARVHGDAAIPGYQARSPRRVVQQLEALIAALRGLGLSYVGLPASFEASGQKVRLPDMLLADGMGNCLDISLLVAACLEQMGLAPLIVVVHGHAFPALWLVDERFPEGVVGDAARLRTLMHLGQLLAFDSSSLVHSERPPLEACVAAARDYLANDHEFVAAVDVRVVRLDRFRPLPVRVTVTPEEAPGAPTEAARRLLSDAMAEPEPEAPPSPSAPPDTVVARFKRWRDRLLDLSLNNRLLNYRPGSRSALPLNVPHLPRFEDLLATDATLELLPRPGADARDTRDATRAARKVSEAELDTTRRADLERKLVHAPLRPDELVVHAVALDRAARAEREEGGANTLFCALGLLRWFETAESTTPRLAPLCLVPVSLDYDRVSRRIRLRRLDEEPMANVTLVEKMRRDHAVDLSGIAALDTDDAGIDVAGLLRRARTAIQRMPRWEVLDEAHLGLFSFTKFLMWRDLEQNAEQLMQSEVVRHLAEGGRFPFEDRVGEPDPRTLDDALPPDALPTVLDCDSTQLSAVSAALRGRSFVLQGPPGTGKSQTITNLIAAALAEQKTVLFVSEKMAALEVVFRRLRDAGLGDYCLELHSRQANKREVALSLGRALDRVARASDADWSTQSAELGGLRTQLNAYARALHAPRPLGLSFYAASSRLLALAHAPEVRVVYPGVETLDRATKTAMATSLDALATAGAPVEPVAAHPFHDSRAEAWSQQGEELARDAIDGAIAQIDEALARTGQLDRLLALTAEPVTMPRLRAFLAAGREESTQRATLAERWKPELFAVPLAPLAQTFRSWANAFFLFAFLFLFFPRQRLAPLARERVPADALIADDLAMALALQSAAPRRAEESAWVQTTLGGLAPASDLDALAHVLDRAERLRGALSEAETRLGIAGLDRVRLVALSGQMSRFRGWCFYRRAASEVERLGLGALVRAHASGDVLASQLAAAGERAILTRWVAATRDAEPALRDFEGHEQRRRVARFQDADRAHILLGRQRVLARLDARRPPVKAGMAESSEPGILAREVKKQRAHMPVRKLLASIPNLLPRLKPCLLMSPLSIAQYLPAGGRPFDLVVFDEASQIGTHDAIGAIARGAQVVIVGDSRQLPPTAFFTRDLGDSDEGPLPDDNDIVEMESILDEALAARMPEQMLGWHYRSRHEALIEFSNRHYYENRLNVFPAARGRDGELGLRWHPVAGRYDKGKTRSNRTEAEALVSWLVAALRGTPAGTKTFGVVTFSLPQQTLVQDLLDQARGQFPEIETHWSDELLEPVFVKNLENVQGDERDVILFSICYGPDETGKTWMNFGPLNRKGGERRLNVAVTRARRALHVFSTMTADHVDLARTTATGARHLKAFLAYAAERGSLAPRPPHPAPFESEFERQVHDAIVELGYRADVQVGCGGYRIDLAVVHPDRAGEYLLGVECDGAAYHSAATARDRDRLRQDVLRGLGWRLHRVWSTDWWFDRVGQVDALGAVLLAARAEAPAEPATPPVVATSPPRDTVEGAAAAPTAALSAPSPLVSYRVATLESVKHGDTEAMYHSPATRLIRARVEQTMVVEAPIHVDELCRRVAACWGLSRVTDRVRRRVLDAAEGAFRLDGEFAWAPGVDPAGWTDIRGPREDGTTRDIELVCPEEIDAALSWTLSHSLSLDEPALVRETARLFGLTRPGRKVDERLRGRVSALVERGLAAREGDRVAWRGAATG